MAHYLRENIDKSKLGATVSYNASKAIKRYATFEVPADDALKQSALAELHSKATRTGTTYMNLIGLINEQKAQLQSVVSAEQDSSKQDMLQTEADATIRTLSNALLKAAESDGVRGVVQLTFAASGNETGRAGASR